MFNRLLTLVFYSVCIFTYLQAQTAYRIAYYNGTGNGADIPKAITADAGGNVYVAGSSWGGNSKEDFVVIKYDRFALQQWAVRYNGPGNNTDVPSAIVIDESGNVYVTGWSRENSNANSENYCTIKYNSSGVQQWVKFYSGPGYDCYNYDFAYAIGLDGSGNIYVTGCSAGSNDDIATVKYSPSGSQLWVARFDGASHKSDIGWSMYVNSNGDVFIGGSSFKDGQNYNAVVIKYNSSGQQQWMTQYNGVSNGNDDAYSIVGDNMGNIVICGSTYSSSTKLDYLIAKYNSQGTLQWTSFYNGSANDTDVACAVDIDSYDGIYVTGSSKGAGTGYDYATLMYGPMGNMFWEQRYNDQYNGNDRAADIEVVRVINPYSQDVWFNCFVTGYTWNGPNQNDYTTICYHSEGTFEWMQKYNGYQNGNDYATCLYARDNYAFMYVSGTINNDFATIWYMKKMISLPNSIGKGGIIDVSPNPFNPQTTFKFSLQQDSEVKLIIYDVMGREVEKIFEGRLSGGIHNYEWNAGRYNSGVYFYKLFIDQEVYTDKLILIK